MANLKRLLSNRMQKMDVNIIREILKVVNQPGMISLAGGIPADESFPMDIFADLTDTVLSEFGTSALQYDVSEGFGPLRAFARTLTQKLQEQLQGDGAHLQ